MRQYLAGLGLAGLMLAGCSSGSRETPVSSLQPTTTPGVSASIAAAPTVAAGRTLASKLDVPWGVAFLGDVSALVAERPTGRIVRVGPAGATPIGTVPGVADQGEGGLLGLAFEPLGASPAGATAPNTPAPRDASAGVLFAYLTSDAGDNRVVRMPFDGTRLGPPTVILKGIASANNHNGGLLTIGPDGKLWIGTGDATISSRAQDRSSLNGKILRLNLDGTIPPDNPFGDSPVYSMGHRNVQGLAFDSKNQPWAIEFGQNRWDELNRIQAGKNYGWPTVEGRSGRSGFVDPVVEWPTQDASPSGMAIVNDVAYVGALRGERLWQVPLDPASGTAGTPKAWLRGQFGRIRNVAGAPDGSLWITTSNRDGRGNAGADDDRVVQLSLGGG